MQSRNNLHNKTEYTKIYLVPKELEGNLIIMNTYIMKLETCFIIH